MPKIPLAIHRSVITCNSSKIDRETVDKLQTRESGQTFSSTTIFIVIFPHSKALKDFAKTSKISSSKIVTMTLTIVA